MNIESKIVIILQTRLIKTQSFMKIKFSMIILVVSIITFNIFKDSSLSNAKIVELEKFLKKNEVVIDFSSASILSPLMQVQPLKVG